MTGVIRIFTRKTFCQAPNSLAHSGQVKPQQSVSTEGFFSGPLKALGFNFHFRLKGVFPQSFLKIYISRFIVDKLEVHALFRRVSICLLYVSYTYIWDVYSWLLKLESIKALRDKLTSELGFRVGF